MFNELLNVIQPDDKQVHFTLNLIRKDQLSQSDLLALNIVRMRALYYGQTETSAFMSILEEAICNIENSSDAYGILFSTLAENLK